MAGKGGFHILRNSETFHLQVSTFRLQSLQTTKSSTTMQNLEYAYDNVGNVQSITDFLTAANSQTFTYDDLNRLLTGNSTAYGTITYTYNEIGNMMSNSRVSTTTGYTYPASGPNSVRPHAVTTAGPNSYTYDANGNMLTGAGRTFDAYDFENRPTSITVGGTTTTFAYDGDGGRVKKQTGSSVIWYISKLLECDGAVCTKMIWSGDRRLVSKTMTTGTLLFYHGDHLGSTSVVTDSTGTQVQALTYYPFGEARSNVPGNPDVAHKYTGKELDATGLYWYEWRSYDPLLARFTTPDTLVPNPRDPQDLNRYSYVGNNPLRYTDPTGHFKVGKFFKRALGSVGTTVLGSMALMVPGLQPLGLVMLSQTQTGRYIAAGYIITGAVAASVACPGCDGGTLTLNSLGTLSAASVKAGLTAAAAKAATLQAVYTGAAIGAVSGGTLGGYSAATNGGDISSGALFGSAVGAATGAAAGYVAGGAPDLSSALAGKDGASFSSWYAQIGGGGFVSNFGYGLASEYAGGRGQAGSMILGSLRNGAYALVTSPLGNAALETAFGDITTNPGGQRIPDPAGGVGSVELPQNPFYGGVSNQYGANALRVTGFSTLDTATELFGNRLESLGRK
jgi:RHS repeat-associated protein